MSAIICVRQIGNDICCVNSPPSSHVSKGALAIVIALVLLSLYANVQRWRRDKVETVTFTPAVPLSSVSPTASPR
jgi:hypothetical protein